jgi:hypothetical protein
MKASVRVNPGNPNHHLWNNHGGWWCHYTVHFPDHTVERIRLSLKTGDLGVARGRRDRLFAALERGVA